MKLSHVACAAAILSVVAGLWVNTASVRAAEIAPASSRQAMSRVVHELDVDGAPLIKVMDYLRNVSGANLIVNWKSLEAAGVARETPISLRVRELTLRKMIQLVLSQASPNAPLSYGVDSNVIQITTQEELDKQLITKVYIVDDLVMVTNNNVQAPRINLSNIGSGGSSGGSGFGGGGSGGSGFGGGQSGGFGGQQSGGYGGSSGGSGGGFFGGNGSGGSGTTSNQPQETSAQKGQELVDLIKNVIRPNIWTDNGGNSTIKYFNGKLIVTAPASVQEAIGGPVGDSAIRFGM